MGLNKRITSALNLPKEVTLDYPKITVIGEESVIIENHKGILEFSEDIIKLNTKLYILKIEGQKLNIRFITNDEMEIVGKRTGIVMS